MIIGTHVPVPVEVFILWLLGLQTLVVVFRTLILNVLKQKFIVNAYARFICLVTVYYLHGTPPTMHSLHLIPDTPFQCCCYSTLSQLLAIPLLLFRTLNTGINSGYLEFLTNYTLFGQNLELTANESSTKTATIKITHHF